VNYPTLPAPSTTPHWCDTYPLLFSFITHMNFLSYVEISLRTFDEVRDTWRRGYTRRGPQQPNPAQHDTQQWTNTSRTVTTSLSSLRNTKITLSTPGISIGPHHTRIHRWLSPPSQRPTCILLVDWRRAVLRGRALKG
jgi:hypothetical protein